MTKLKVKNVNNGKTMWIELPFYDDEKLEKGLDLPEGWIFDQVCNVDIKTDIECLKEIFDIEYTYDISVFVEEYEKAGEKERNIAAARVENDEYCDLDDVWDMDGYEYFEGCTDMEDVAQKIAFDYGMLNSVPSYVEYAFDYGMFGDMLENEKTFVESENGMVMFP